MALAAQHSCTLTYNYETTTTAGGAEIRGQAGLHEMREPCGENRLSGRERVKHPHTLFLPTETNRGTGLSTRDLRAMAQNMTYCFLVAAMVRGCGVNDLYT